MTRILKLINLLRNVLGYTSVDWDSIGSRNSALIQELLNHSVQNTELSDEEAAHLLLRTDLKDPNYRRVNTKLTDVLFEEILRFTPSSTKYSRYQINYFQNQKLITVFRILKGLNQSALCYYLAKKLHRRSKTFHFTGIRLETSKYLLKYYCYVKPNHSLSELYAVDHELSLDMLKLEETLASKTYLTISTILRQKGNYKKELSETLSLLNDLEKHLGIPSGQFHLIFYMLRMTIYEELGENKKVLKAAREGLQYFENINYEQKVAKTIFLESMSDSYINLGYTTEAVQTLQKSLSLTDQKGLNWLNQKTLLIKLECRRNKFDEAYMHYNDIKESKNLDSLPNHTKSHLLQLDLMFFYLHLKGEVLMNKILPINRVRKMIKSLDNEGGYEKEYSIILGLLIAIHYKSKMIFNISSLDKSEYTDKRIKKNNPLFKKNCLIKMLILILENDFHPVAVERKTSGLAAKLNAEYSEDGRRFSDEELVPYNYLWQLAISDLANSNHTVLV